MSNKSTAAESIRRLALQYQDMVEVADFLESAGSQETMVAESKKAAQAANDERDLAIEGAKQAKVLQKQAQAEADDIIRIATQKAAEIEANSMRQANKLLDEAEAKANFVRVTAQAEADGMVSKAGTDVETLNSQLAGLQATVAELEKNRAKAEQAADSAKSKLDAVQESIRKLAQA